MGLTTGEPMGPRGLLQVAKAIIKCSGEMQNDLCGKRLVGNLLEQCDTPLIRKPDFSTTDGCWLSDEMEGDVRSVVPHADNNVYLSIPHPTGDPVMAADKDRVLEFLRTTFFDNYRCPGPWSVRLGAHRVFLRSSSLGRRPTVTDKRLREDLYITVVPGRPGGLNTSFVRSS